MIILFIWTPWNGNHLTRSLFEFRLFYSRACKNSITFCRSTEIWDWPQKSSGKRTWEILLPVKMTELEKVLFFQASGSILWIEALFLTYIKTPWKKISFDFLLKKKSFKKFSLRNILRKKYWIFCKKIFSSSEKSK